MDKLAKKFYFVRHAESLWNIKKLCQGRRDIELSPKGLQDTVEFAKKLSTFPIECIFSSPLIRALRTAETIQSYQLDSNLTVIEEFTERDWGELEGISSEQMYAIEKEEEENPDFDPGKKIESRKELKARVEKGLKKAFDLSTTPFIVSHGRLFLGLCDLLNIPIIRQIQNLSLLEIKCINSVWSINNITDDLQ